ncbi:hypothetical protein DVT68_09030 [Dyella solisilvae]|uniref:DUF5615 domain-containing protein n=1 Tax=Dyella solisilvae TaxID=1920168 RepID=A0A370K7N1_9GAMM|nr:DUF5615 family PIN-like protein [Dyella solisilvae]RDI98655.1 hypothetical protein DVT68_09030 [Dyella solisilvae]
MWRNPEELPSVPAIGTHEDPARPVRDGARFYADEAFPLPAVELLHSVGACVETAAEARLLGRDAEAHAAHALARNLALFTCDRRFLDESRFPLQRSPAIFVFEFGDGSPRDIRRAFRCLAPVIASAQFGARRCKVDAHGDAWIEHFRHGDGSHTRTCRRLWRGRLQQWVEPTALAG